MKRKEGEEEVERDEVRRIEEYKIERRR